MKIVEQSARLIGLMFPYQFDVSANDYVIEFCPEKLVEKSGRICYKSEDRITVDSAAAFIEMISKNHHESVLEHSCASFHIVCDRGVSHEIVRHRIASYSQESTRYCNYNKDKFGGEITVIEPPGLTQEEREIWESSVLISEAAYMKLVSKCVKPQIARSVLPTCLKTELVMTANFREWKHFIRLRTSPAAHPQMVEVAKMVEESLKKVAPTVFGGRDDM